MGTIAAAVLLMAMLASSCTLEGPDLPVDRQTPGVAPSHVISGRVVDPPNLKPEHGTLMIGVERDDRFSRRPVQGNSDGTFTNRPVTPGTYVPEMVRTPDSPTHAAITVGFRVVHVGTADVSDVVAVRRDTSITGRFRVESDPKVAWAPQDGATVTR